MKAATSLPYLLHHYYCNCHAMDILAWINTIKRERKYTFYICVWWGKIFCCNSCSSKIFNTLSECNVILPPQLTCSIQMSIHFNSWKEQKTLKYVNIYMGRVSRSFSSHGKMGKGKLKTVKFSSNPPFSDAMCDEFSFVFYCCQLCHWGIREKEVNKRG